MKPVTLYGIPNCDTVKKARAWLAAREAAPAFHDFKKAGLTADRLKAWSGAAGWEKLLNRRGTSWRQLDEAAQAQAVDEAGALKLMLLQPSLVKRPVVEWEDGSVTVGFDEAAWEDRLR